MQRLARQVWWWTIASAVAALTVLIAGPISAGAAVTDRFNWPVDGTTFTNDVAWHQANEGQKAVDIAASARVPVYAAADGVVEYAGPQNAPGTCKVDGRVYPAGFGNLVTIQHLGSTVYHTTYGHLTEWTVTSGQLIRRGQQIGTVGSTGCSTGNHVHFQIGTCSETSVSAIVVPHGCSMWNAPDTTAAPVTHNQLMPGSYPGLRDLPPFMSIVQWDGDTNAQRASWLVGRDNRRRWVPDIRTYNCLRAQGIVDVGPQPAYLLNQVQDRNGIWAMCPGGDVNRDGTVNIVDLSIMAGQWGRTGGQTADANYDGVVNIIDLSVLGTNYGRSWG